MFINTITSKYSEIYLYSITYLWSSCFYVHYMYSYCEDVIFCTPWHYFNMDLQDDLSD